MADQPSTGKQVKEFEVTTTAQVERTYIVQAESDRQAHDRLRIYLKDADLLKEGLVTPGSMKDSTPQRVTGAIKPLARPKSPAATGAPAASES